LSGVAILNGKKVSGHQIYEMERMIAEREKEINKKPNGLMKFLKLA
jgi:hypothetical protein